MNPFLLILFQAGLNIANGHLKNAAGGQILDLSSFILDAAKALDSLHEEETGQPLDWSKIREHQPLAPPGSPEEPSPVATESLEAPEAEDPPSEPPADET